MAKELAEIRNLYKFLLQQGEQLFPKPNGRLNASTEQGVYVISDSKGIVVHVGRTKGRVGGIRERLKDHLYTRSSFTKKYKYLDGDGSQLRDTYTYKYVTVSEPRLRTLLEAYTISHLCPKHLGTG